MKDILVPISPGELLDKITILRIKVARIADAAKLANVRLELDLLEKTWRDCGCAAFDVTQDERALQQVNERLWDIEDRIRGKEAKQTFDRTLGGLGIQQESDILPGEAQGLQSLGHGTGIIDGIVQGGNTWIAKAIDPDHDGPTPR